RIAMMNKLKSARMNLVRFLFIVPLVAAMLLAFRSGRTPYPPAIRTAVSSSNRPVASLGQQVADTVPSRRSVKSGNANNQGNPSNPDNFEITEDRAVVLLKDGMTEIYDLKDKEQRKKFREKYGILIVDCIVQVAPSTPPTPVTNVSVAAAGMTTVVSPVNVVSNVNSTVNTSMAISTRATSANTNVTTVVGSPEVTSTNEIVVDDNGAILNGKEEIL